MPKGANKLKEPEIVLGHTKRTGLLPNLELKKSNGNETKLPYQKCRIYASGPQEQQYNSFPMLQVEEEVVSLLTWYI